MLPSLVSIPLGFPPIDIPAVVNLPRPASSEHYSRVVEARNGARRTRMAVPLEPSRRPVRMLRSYRGPAEGRGGRVPWRRNPRNAPHERIPWIQANAMIRIAPAISPNWT